MGKKRHSKDKLYINPKEYAEVFGGFKKKQSVSFKSLPFYCCGLALTPFTTPVCTEAGIVFEVENIVPFVKKYNRNPINGQPLKLSELIPLHFHKNKEGQFHCPVTFKVFNDHTHIVANRKSGHVYSYDAIENLCRIPKSWKDLITGEPFRSSDLITVQHPHDVNARQIEEFDYIKRGLEISVKPIGEASEAPTILPTESITRVLDETKAAEAEAIKKHNAVIPQAIASTLPTNRAPANAEKHPIYTTHRQAASFTSSVIDKSWKIEYRDKTEREIMQKFYDRVKKQKKKGYVQLQTNKGTLNIELQCNLAPVACDNFLRHCQAGYYDGTIFHRCIANFMIQGGDPTGTGKGGESAFEAGLPFEDEFHPHLVHKGLGIVSMANSGKHTNKSQFFITFKSCEHLNNKHTVFGRVVGGLETLKLWEKLAVNNADRPKDPPKIEATIVFSNPFEQAKTEMQEEEEHELREANKVAKNAGLTWLGPAATLDAMENHPNRHSESIGKYIGKPNQATKQVIQPTSGTTETSSTENTQNTFDEYASIPKKKKLAREHFDFSKW